MNNFNFLYIQFTVLEMCKLWQKQKGSTENPNLTLTVMLLGDSSDAACEAVRYTSRY